MPSTFTLESSVLSAVDDLSLVARGVVEGFFDGLHRSPFLGYSTEFSAYRPYAKGDNLKHIDWKVWGRTDELYVKQFEDDTNVRCQVLLDVSGSMDFGAGDTNKFAYGRLLAAALAYLMVRQHDAPGLVLFGAGGRQVVPPVAARHQAEEIFHALASARPGGVTALGPELLQIVDTIMRRGFAVVISDFFSAEESVFELLRRLHARGQEILVFHVLAPEELELPYEGEFLMEDAETGEEIVVHGESFREEYRTRVEAFCDRVRAECVRYEVEYRRLRTDERLDLALMTYLESRAAYG